MGGDNRDHYRSGYENRAGLQMDVATDTYHNKDDGKYYGLFGNKPLTKDALYKFYLDMIQEFPFVILEDPFNEDDYETTAAFTRDSGIQIVGDDLFTTNLDRVAHGISLGAANTVLLKVNQVGTISEAMEMIQYAYKHGYAVMPSDSRGEGDAIGDYAVGINAGSVRECGIGPRANRLLAIEEELGASAKFIGAAGLKGFPQIRKRAQDLNGKEQQMYKQYYGGKLVDGQGAPMDVVDPATGEVIGTVGCATAEQTLEALASAERAQKAWAKTSLDERIGWMLKLRDACMAEREKIIDLVSAESGRPYPAACGDFDWMMTSFHYYAEEARRVYGTTFNNHSTAQRQCLSHRSPPSHRRRGQPCRLELSPGQCGAEDRAGSRFRLRLHRQALQPDAAGNALYRGNRPPGSDSRQA